MKNHLVKTLSLVISLVLLLSATACKKKETAAPEESTAASYKPASEAGITDYGWIPESAFPNHDGLEDWYEKSKERTSLVYAVYYAKDAETSIWYCWLWAEGYVATDTVTLSVDDTAGTCVHVDITVQNEEALSMGAYCFAIPSEVEPSFALTVNGSTEGMIVSLGSVPAIPLS